MKNIINETRVYHTTNNSETYRRLRNFRIEVKYGLCPYCLKHSGCNHWNGGGRNARHSWKNYRKTQWKNG